MREQKSVLEELWELSVWGQDARRLERLERDMDELKKLFAEFSRHVFSKQEVNQ